MQGYLLLVLSCVALAVIRKYQDWRRAIRSIQDSPGLRFVFGPQTYLLQRRIPYLVAGSFSPWTGKHRDFAYHGRDILSMIRLLPSTDVMFAVADPEALREITGARARFPKPLQQYEPLKCYGSNIVATEAEEWKRHRKICAPSFSERNNRLVWDETMSIVRELCDEVWQGRDSVDIDNVVDLTIPLALFVISVAGFGRRLSWKEDLNIPAGHTMAFKDALHVISVDLWIRALLPTWIVNWAPIPRVRKFRIAFDELGRYMSEMIQQRKNSETKEARYDLLSSLLDANEEEADSSTKLTDSEVMGDIFVFLVAGHETTAHTLAFTFILLALHQDQQEILYKQIKSVIPDDRTPSFEDMGKLTYCMAVFMETLRLFPPLIYIPKHSAEDTTLYTRDSKGERVAVPCPAGSDISIHAPGLHYNPRYWDDPYAFKPSRFLGDWPRDAFMSFSAGPRSCLGRRFSETEAVAMLAYLVSKYKMVVKEEPQFAAESFEQRKERLLKCDSTITLYPTKAPLIFKRR